MNNHDLEATIHNLQQQILALQQHAEAQSLRAVELELVDPVASAVPPHFQIAPLKQDERNQILKPFPKVKGLLPVSDINGLAAKGLSADKKQWVTKDLVAQQRDNIDVVRVAGGAWQYALDPDIGLEQRFNRMVEALRAVTILAADNAQKAAEKQLLACLEGVGAKGADSLLDRTPSSVEYDWNDHNIFQQCHLDAIGDYRRFASSVEAAGKKASGGGRGRGGGASRGQGHGAARSRGGGGGRGRGYGGRGRSGGRGGGYGGQQPPAQVPAPNGL